MNENTFSLVMPAFNEERYVGAMLDSIFSQSRQPDEIIVVDDRSTDTTPTILDGYAAAHPHMKVFHLPENVGVSRAVLFGLDQATGIYVCPVSSNDLLPSGGVFEMGMDLLARYPGAAYFTGDPASLGANGQMYWRQLGYADSPCFIAPEQVLQLPIAENPIHSAGLWVRRDLLLDLPGWQDIGYACDRWFLHVLAFRHGFCYAPIPAYAMRDHDRPQLSRERRLIVESKVLDLLDSPAYADVRAALIASGVFAADGWGPTFLEVVLRKYDALRGHVDPPIHQTIGHQVLGIPVPTIPLDKTHAVLAFADELISQPELAHAYVNTFSPADDVTLVVYAPGQDPSAVAAHLAQAAPELASESAPDALLLAIPEARDAVVARRCSAVLTQAPLSPAFSGLQPFTYEKLADLKRLVS